MILETGSPPPPQLKRVLGIRDLVIYGLILIQPIAPVGIFGLACAISHGTPLPRFSWRYYGPWGRCGLG